MNRARIRQGLRLCLVSVVVVTLFTIASFVWESYLESIHYSSGCLSALSYVIAVVAVGGVILFLWGGLTVLRGLLGD